MPLDPASYLPRPPPLFNFAWVPKKIGKTQVHPSGPEAYTRVDPGLLIETPTYVLVKIPKAPLRDFRPHWGGNLAPAVFLCSATASCNPGSAIALHELVCLRIHPIELFRLEVNSNMSN